MGRTHRKKSEMYPLVEAYRNRTVTQTAFCEEHQIKHSTLAYWISRYNKEHCLDKPASLFRPVRVCDTTQLDSLSVHLPSGIRVTLSTSVLTESTAAFIRSLSRQ